jgi:hypothetical protein
MTEDAALLGLDAIDVEIMECEVKRACSLARRWMPGIDVKKLLEDLEQEAKLAYLEHGGHGENIRRRIWVRLEALVKERRDYNVREGTELHKNFAPPDGNNWPKALPKLKMVSALEPGREYVNKKWLTDRGWTRGAIKEYLDAPDRTTLLRRNRSRPECRYDKALVLAVEESHDGPPRLRARKDERPPLGLADLLKHSASLPVATSEQIKVWLSEEHSDVEFRVGYPWCVDRLIFATKSGLLHIFIGTDFPYTYKGSFLKRKDRKQWLPCPKCPRYTWIDLKKRTLKRAPRCAVLHQVPERVWVEGMYPVGAGVAMPVVVHGRAIAVYCNEHEICEIEPLRDLHIREQASIDVVYTDAEGPYHVHQVRTRPNYYKAVVRPAL